MAKELIKHTKEQKMLAIGKIPQNIVTEISDHCHLTRQSRETRDQT